MLNSIQAVKGAQTLAEAIVNTLHEPFLALDAEFRALAASRSFYEIFKVDPEQTLGCMLYALGDRASVRPQLSQWPRSGAAA